MRGRTQHCRCDDAGFRGRFERRKRVPRLDQSLQKFPAEPEVSGGTWCFPSSTRNALTSCAERLSANSDASAGTCGRGRIHDAPPIGSARSGPAQPQGVDLLLFGPTRAAIQTTMDGGRTRGRRYAASTGWSSRRLAKRRRAVTSASSRSGSSSTTSAAPRPAASRSGTSITRIRIPRTHARRPMQGPPLRRLASRTPAATYAPGLHPAGDATRAKW